MPVQYNSSVSNYLGEERDDKEEVKIVDKQVQQLNAVTPDSFIAQ